MAGWDEKRVPAVRRKNKIVTVTYTGIMVYLEDTIRVIIILLEAYGYH